MRFVRTLYGLALIVILGYLAYCFVLAALREIERYGI